MIENICLSSDKYAPACVYSSPCESKGRSLSAAYLNCDIFYSQTLTTAGEQSIIKLKCRAIRKLHVSWYAPNKSSYQLTTWGLYASGVWGWNHICMHVLESTLLPINKLVLSVTSCPDVKSNPGFINRDQTW